MIDFPLKSNSRYTYTKMFNGISISVNIYTESRTDVRFSAPKGKVIMRLPNFCTKLQQEEQFQRFETWVQQLFDNNEQFTKLQTAAFWPHGHNFLFCGVEKTFIHRHAKNEQFILRHDGNQIVFEFPPTSTEAQRMNILSQNLGKFLAQRAYPYFLNKVIELNNRHFNQSFVKVNLHKANTKWGSCNSKGVLSFSRNLVIAPPEVIEYVIVHELAHLIELNHSDRFWALVEKACPNYRHHENWLKQEGHKLMIS